MTLLKVLFRESAGLLICSILASLITAGLMIYLLSIVSQYLASPAHFSLMWWELLIVILAGTASQILATLMISRLSQRIVRTLRTTFVNRVLQSPLVAIEVQGSSKILAALVEDATRVADAIPGVIAIARDLTFIAACFVYLAILSLNVTGVTLAVIAAAALVVYPLQAMAGRHVYILRSHYQSLFSLFRNVLDGIKQIKLSARQHRGVTTEIEAKEVAIGRANSDAFIALSFANAFAVAIFMLLVEMMIFGGLQAFSDRHVMIAYMLVLVFILSPLQSITATFGSLTKAQVAINRFDQLQNDLQEAATESCNDALEPTTPAVRSASSWRELRFTGVRYTHQTSDRQHFELGPVDFMLRPGQLLFVIGGNGSGKTTLAKLLVGLYVPGGGEIRIDENIIGDHNRAWYRSHFAAVFTDFSLFEGLADSPNERFGSEDPELVKLLKLDHVLDNNKGIFAQSASFSTGERHRAALLLACLDDRPIYVLDEFAADQDPDCKELFYNKVLDRMKKDGKLVIIITHDSRYFDRADCTMFLERGEVPRLSVMTDAAAANYQPATIGTSV